MKSYDKLRSNISNLIEKYKDLQDENSELKAQVLRVQKDMDFIEGKNQEYPDILTKNKKLVEERTKTLQKVEVLLNRLEEVKI